VGWLKSLFGSKEPHTVRINPSVTSIAVQDGETVLERALKEGLAYPHDCTVGTCGACRTKLLSGKVDAITPFGYTLSREELEAGYILACQALPKTDLELEIDLSATDMEHVTTKARIAATSPLTHDILKVDWEADAPIPFRAGQYVNIRWDGSATHRSYSFATAPEATGGNRVTFFVRHVPGGVFTDQLFGGTAHNLSFELDGPHGNFWLRAGKGPLLCIAGGSGLAPLMSLLQDAAKRRVRRDCVLLFGGRAKRDLYGEAEISAIRSAWTAGFDYWPVLSETPEPGLREGMVTAHIAAALERLGPDAQAYLCGPPGMIDAAMAELAKQGVPLDAIFYDKFTDASSAPA
jgi:p-cymene monooxygenase electron transfer component